jgi:hypothetical protein
VKDHYVSYKDVEPFASLVGIGVDLSQNIHNLPEEGVGQLITSTFNSLKNNIADKTFFSSLAQQSELFQPDKWTEHTGQTIGGLVTAAVIPGSSFINHASNIVMGNTLKEPKGFMQNMLSRVPFTQQLLPDKLNDLGEEINVPLGKRVTGWGYGESDHNTVNDELTNLAKDGLKLPAPKSDKNGVDLVSYVSSEGMTAYEAVNRRKATITLGGKTLRQSLDNLISSNFYQKLPTGQSIEQEGWTQNYSSKYTKIGQISRVYQRYLDSALNETISKGNFSNENSGIPLKNDYITARSSKIPNLSTTQSLQNIFGGS